MFPFKKGFILWACAVSCATGLVPDALAYTSPYKISYPASTASWTGSGNFTNDFEEREQSIQANSTPPIGAWYTQTYPTGSYGPTNPQLYSSASSATPLVTQAFASWDRGGPVFNTPINVVPQGVNPITWKQARVMAAASSFLGTTYEHLHLPWFNPAKAGYSPSQASSNETLQTSQQLAQHQPGTTPNPYYPAYAALQAGIDCTDFSALIYNLALGVQMYSGTPSQIKFTSGDAPAPGNAPTASLLDDTGTPISPTFFKSPNYGKGVLNAPGSLSKIIKQLQPGDLLYMTGADGAISHVVVWLGQYGTLSNGKASKVPLVISSHDNTPAIFDTTQVNRTTGLPSDGNIAGHLPPPGVEILPFAPGTWFYTNFSVAMRVLK